MPRLLAVLPLTFLALVDITGSLSRGTAYAAGFVVTPTYAVTNELGPTMNFTIVLTDPPSANVTIPLTSNDTSEGTVSPANVVFTPSNYFLPLTVTVTPQNDAFADGPQLFVIQTGGAISTDIAYNGFDGPDVVFVNLDEDVASIVVTPTLGLNTTEGLGTATFTIALSSQPFSNVTIGLTSNDTSEGTVLPSSVTFTPVNWFTTQTVTVTGVDDAADDDNIAYAIVTAAATSSDPIYNGMNAADVAVMNMDNELTPGFIVTPTAGLVTTEAGAQAGFNISLSRAPTANVTIGLTNSDPTEGAVSPASVTFTTANWATPQAIVIFPVDDLIADGNVGYAVLTQPASSTDLSYNGLNPTDVSATNNDNDVAGIVVSQTAGHVTTEAGGVAGFTIRLNSQPTANVTIGLTSNDTSEGTVSPSSVTFTIANFSTTQLVNVTGVDDAIDDENIGYAIVTAAATSTDPVYNGWNAPDVGVTNNDNELNSGFIVSQTAGHVTTEAGFQAGFNLSLSRAPTANVTIGLNSSDLTEGTVSPASVTFTSANFSTPQLVIVNPVDDLIADGNVGYAVFTQPASSTDVSYNGFNPPDVSLTNNDNDLAEFVVTPTAGLITSETGGIATFTIRLNSQPTANVVIGLTSSDLTEGTVSPSSVTFTTANWLTPQTVTVTGLNDGEVDCDKAYAVVTAAATSADPGYAGRNPSDVAVMNDDDETVINVGPNDEGVSLALSPIHPNPSRGNALSVRFALPSAAHAELELLDVGGRRLAIRDVGLLGAGWHTVDVAEGGLAPGIYWVQLVQGSYRRMSRVTVLR